MELRTVIPLKTQQHNQIDYTSNLLLLGSCFSENIGEKIAYYKFQHTINPFGILFHPKAIENCILRAINKNVYTEADLLYHNERWHCFDAHSALSAPNKKESLSALNEAVIILNRQLHSATHIVITLGTAWTYRFIESDVLVANCHKVPQKKFLKELLSIQEITESLDAIYTLIKSVNNKASILFTVSPVRHLKDGFIENMVSKSHLISAVYQVVNGSDTFYFPSYELMMDELRDYRFYREDMIHLNQTAVNYIWKQFSRVWISDTSTATMKSVETVQKGLLHKPFSQHSKQYQDFLENLEHKISSLKEAYPFMTF